MRWVVLAASGLLIALAVVSAATEPTQDRTGSRTDRHAGEVLGDALHGAGPQLQGRGERDDTSSRMGERPPDPVAPGGDAGSGDDLVLVAATTDRDAYDLGEPIRIHRFFENPTDRPITVSVADWRRQIHREVVLKWREGARLYEPPLQDVQTVTVQPHGRIDNWIDVELPASGGWVIEVPPEYRTNPPGRPCIRLSVTVLDRSDPRFLAAKAERLARAIEAEDPDCPTCWTEAQKDLQSLGDAAVPSLRRWLGSSRSPQLRAVSAKILGPLVSSSGVGRQELIAGLADVDPNVRRMCVLALPASAEALEAVLPLLRDPDVWVRVDAIEVVARHTDPRVVPALLPLLKDQDGYVCQRAAVALAEKGSPAGVHVLMAALRSDPAGSAFPVVDALEKLTGVAFGEAEMPGCMSTDEGIERAVAANKALAKRWLQWWEDEGRSRFGD